MITLMNFDTFDIMMGVVLLWLMAIMSFCVYKAAEYDDAVAKCSDTSIQILYDE